MVVIFYILQGIFGIITALQAGVKEKIMLVGLAYPIAFGFLTIVSFVFDLVGIPISMLSGFIALIVGLLAMLYFNKDSLRQKIHNVHLANVGGELIHFMKFNWGLLFLIGVLIYLLYGISLKAMIWPSAAYDTIAGYDFLAKVISVEHALNNSIFDTAHSLVSLRSSYPPLIPINLGFAYMAGLEYPKIVSVLVLLSSSLISLSLMYSTTKNWFFAFLFTFIFLSTPEYISMSALSMTNVCTALYAGFGLIFIYRFFKSSSWADFNIGTLLLFLGMWTRTEVIIFGLVGILLVGYWSKTNKNFKPTIILSALIFGSFVIWKIYVDMILAVETQQSIQFIPFYDSQKLSDLVRLVKSVTFSTQYFGWIVYLFLFFIISFVLKKSRKEHLLLFSIIMFTWIAYVALYYQMNNTNAEGKLIPNYITAGYRRGFFSFLPLMVYFMASSSFITVMTEWIQKKLKVKAVKA